MDDLIAQALLSCGKEYGVELLGVVVLDADCFAIPAASASCKLLKYGYYIALYRNT